MKDKKTSSSKKASRKLSEKEYIRMLSEIQSHVFSNACPDDTEESLNERRAALEFELAIEYKLCRDFPEDRRKTMWQVQQKINRYKKSLTSQFLSEQLDSVTFAAEMQNLVASMAQEYAKILSPEELRAFLGIKPGEIPVLPIDLDKMK